MITLFYISEEDFNSRMTKIQNDNKSKERKEKLKAEKSKYRQKLKIETSKLLAIYLFIIFNIILIYTLVVMWEFEDLSYLGALITDIVAQILVYAIYCLKAYNGKKQEEQLKFEKEKLFGSLDIDSDIEIDSNES